MNKISLLSITSQSLKQRTLQQSFPEYYDLESIVENNGWHLHQNVLDHVIGVFEGLEKTLKNPELSKDQEALLHKYLSQIIGKKSRKENLIAATLLHDIAKHETFVKNDDGTTSCPGHELAGVERVKDFSDRFDLDEKDQREVEQIVRYHGYISEVLHLMMAQGDDDNQLNQFKDKVGDVAVELVLLMRADLLGSDLVKSDKEGFDVRMKLLRWMLQKLLVG